MTMIEIWKPVVGWETMYQVSNFGNVGSFWKRLCLGVGRGSKCILSDVLKPMKLTPDNRGYLYVIFKDGQGLIKRYPVARLVLEAFVGPCPSGCEACHFPDPTPSNNSVNNLRWDTHKENQRDVSRMGRVKSAKLNPSKVRQIRKLLAKGIRQIDIAAQLGIHQTVISEIKLGYVWSWVDQGRVVKSPD